MMDCPFCNRIASSDYSPHLSNSTAVVFVPLHPVTPGHLLVVSRTHIHDVTQDPMTAGRVMELAASIARGVGDANIITSIGPAAIQTVRHLNLHIIPRVEGDDLALRWAGQQ
jgi:histidine triad (HIT) family protein